MKFIIVALFLLNTASAKVQLLGRYGVVDSFDFPSLSYAPNATPYVNDKDNVALRVNGVMAESRGAIWLNSIDGGEARFLTETDYEIIVHHIGLGNDSLLFTTGTVSEVRELYQQGLKDKEPELLLSYGEVLDYGYISNLGYIDNGIPAAKASRGRASQRLIYLDSENNVWRTYLRKLKTNDYVFSPVYSGTGSVAVKVWETDKNTANGIVETIHYYELDQGRMKLMNKYLIPEKFTLRNNIDINKNGEIAFYIQEKGSLKNYLNIWNPQNNSVAGLDITQLNPQSFSPAICGNGSVYIKGHDSIARYHMGTAKIVLRKNDELQTDKGIAVLSSKFGDNYTFNYGIDCSNKDVLTFKAALNDEKLGVGIFSLR